MPSRARLFALLVVVCVVVAAAAIAAAVRNGRATGTPEAAPTARGAFAAARAEGAPLLVFRSLSRKRPKTYGQIAFAGLGASGPARTLLPLRCERIHFAADRGLCLARGGGFASGYRAQILGLDLRVREEIALKGVPSRTRVSPDGRFGATTFFVSGHSYAETGAFSTQTMLIDLRRGAKIGDLEDFAIMRDGKRVRARDRNYWGVTFARDSDRFYATLQTGDTRYLVQGSVSARSGRTLHENVECPSLSPDGSRVAYKKRVGSGTAIWRLHVLDLETMRETRLAESRAIDDQVEWLDDARILYKVDEQIWSVRADGSGRSQRFQTSSDSPAVVRG